MIALIFAALSSYGLAATEVACRDLKLVIDAPESAFSYVVFHKPGAGWKPNTSCFEQPLIEDHKAYWLNIRGQELTVQGGPFLDCSGGMVVFKKGTTLNSVCSLAEVDPAVVGKTLSFEV